ncbi:hypothetical protein [Bradyrhizobium phage BDU-MI-1]|nr:hypothetical protein [Bradyrhizobium phage BDU-MI-1]
MTKKLLWRGVLIAIFWFSAAWCDFTPVAIGEASAATIGAIYAWCWD